jgi:proteasome lid subunit RPN8/RPN11
LAAIRFHGEAGYPFEICGFLVGRVGGGDRIAVHAWPVRNAWEDDPAARAAMLTGLADETATADRWQSEGEGRRFLVDPKELLAAMKRARARGLEIVGVYHTHPNHPAVPSAFDRAAAWPEWSYLILSVRQGRAREARSWVLADEGPFQEETIRSLAPGEAVRRR